jgi:hypothetical protein
MEAVARADYDAVGVLATKARSGNNVGHKTKP